MGGGVMRAAAKAAAGGGYRVAHPPWVDQAAAAAARRSARPPPAGLPVPGQAADGAPLLSAASPAQSAPVDAGAADGERRTSWNVDGWEVVVRDEEKLFDALRPPAPARLVFGPVPTLEEAKEATSDLKDALEKLYFSPIASDLQGPAVAATSTLSESSCLENMDAKNRCAAVVPSVPRHVVQAFSLLQGCPEAKACGQKIKDSVVVKIVGTPPGPPLDPLLGAEAALPRLHRACGSATRSKTRRPE